MCRSGMRSRTVDCISLDRLLDEDLIGIDPATPSMKDLRHAARHIRRAPRVKFNVNVVEATRSAVPDAGAGSEPATLRYAGGSIRRSPAERTNSSQ